MEYEIETQSSYVAKYISNEIIQIMIEANFYCALGKGQEIT